MHRTPSPKQAVILRELEAVGTITLKRAVDLIGGDLYANAPKHCGVLLANMVRRGMINRVSPGVFAAVPKPKLEWKREVLEIFECICENEPDERCPIHGRSTY